MMMTWKTVAMAGLLALGLAPGCRGDDKGGDKKSEPRVESPAGQGGEVAAPNRESAPGARERPTLEPPTGARPPRDFNRPPAVQPKFEIKLDKSGRQVTYEVQPDGSRKSVGN